MFVFTLKLCIWFPWNFFKKYSEQDSQITKCLLFAHEQLRTLWAAQGPEGSKQESLVQDECFSAWYSSILQWDKHSRQLPHVPHVISNLRWVAEYVRQHNLTRTNSSISVRSYHAWLILDKALNSMDTWVNYIKTQCLWYAGLFFFFFFSESCNEPEEAICPGVEAALIWWAWGDGGLDGISTGNHSIKYSSQWRNNYLSSLTMILNSFG